ncbi:pantoate--beta-alanine ligase [Nocardioides marmoriginsengisoli]|uniref:Pantothenate synthetase n=1 Tax=Nocardioides marmoriginsengisoli TaxID=661483 RepID=A0A3N0CFJ3_9ACTN|nr:pantoate--beta-alanine ligase [Nocardioides marmoriginsengisoli]RNL62237.1 pantoate--beta-alanine ligase [Nocardioides marmoriginsengisoli]
MTTTLLRADTRADLAAALTPTRLAGRQVAFVPTMGALHDGHLALMRHARELVGPDGALVVSIFVNPLQFGPNEDLDRYPRTLDADLDACAGAGVDVVFTPDVAEVYPNGVPFASDAADVTVDPGPLARILEGASRPGHFRGVLTVVAKLFGLVRPDVAVFGQKDYQQLALLRRMAADLCLGIEVVGAETVREPDGLALSSRNRFLDADQRAEAMVLSRALLAAQEDATRGAAAALGAARAALRTTHLVDVDYLEITDPDLGPTPESGAARMLIAARVGSTRLIDNVALDLGAATEGGS